VESGNAPGHFVVACPFSQNRFPPIGSSLRACSSGTCSNAIPAHRRPPVARWRRSPPTRTTPVARQEKSAACASARNRRRPALRHRDTRACSFRQGNRCAEPSGSDSAVLPHPAARAARQDRPVPPDRRHPDRPSGQAGRAGLGRPSGPGRSRRGRITRAPPAKRPTKSVAGVPLFPSVCRQALRHVLCHVLLCHVLGTATSVPT
jgi:hypothetical protein